MRQMMRQLPPFDPSAEILLPSCGAAVAVVAAEVTITPTCVDVTLDNSTPPENTLVTATARLVRANGSPLSGQTLHWRVMQVAQILAEGQGTTDGNGEITFSYTVSGAGIIYEFVASFFGNPEVPSLTEAQKWIGCSRVVCPTGEIGPGPGPGVGQVVGQPPFCGLGCGQDICESDGLDPTD